MLCRLTATYAKIFKIFRQSCLLGDEQHNITKEKKEFQSLNEMFNRHFTIYSSLTMAKLSAQQYKKLSQLL